MDQHEIDFKRYEIVRGYIEHEDSLINQRLTWLLVSQGLIFSAFTGLFGSISDFTAGSTSMMDCTSMMDRVSTNDAVNQVIVCRIYWIQFVLSVLGFLLSVVSYISINSAVLAVNKIKEDFDGKCSNDGKRLTKDCVSYRAKLPEVIAGGEKSAARRAPLATRGIPIVLGVAWIFVFLFWLPFSFQRLVVVGFLIGVSCFVIGITGITSPQLKLQYSISKKCLTDGCTQNGDTSD